MGGVLFDSTPGSIVCERDTMYSSSKATERVSGPTGFPGEEAAGQSASSHRLEKEIDRIKHRIMMIQQQRGKHKGHDDDDDEEYLFQLYRLRSHRDFLELELKEVEHNELCTYTKSSTAHRKTCLTARRLHRISESLTQ